LLAKHFGRAAFGERRSALRVFLGAVDMKLVATHAPTPCKIWPAIYHDPAQSSQRDRDERARFHRVSKALLPPPRARQIMPPPHRVNLDRNEQ
jgi:hypothetical protein